MRATMMNPQRNDRKPHEENSEGMLIEPWVGNAQAATELCLVLVINVDHLLLLPPSIKIYVFKRRARIVRSIPREYFAWSSGDRMVVS